MLTIASLPYCSLFVFTKWGVKVQRNIMYPNIKISGIGAFREIICLLSQRKRYSDITKSLCCYKMRRQVWKHKNGNRL